MNSMQRCKIGGYARVIRWLLERVDSLRSGAKDTDERKISQAEGAQDCEGHKMEKSMAYWGQNEGRRAEEE